MTNQHDSGDARLAPEETNRTANIQRDQLPVHGGFAATESGPYAESGKAATLQLGCRSVVAIICGAVNRDERDIGLLTCGRTVAPQRSATQVNVCCGLGECLGRANDQ